eukprot:796848-Ditylum_brightwellii.AAC.1
MDATLLRELKQQYQAPKLSQGQRLQDLVATISLDLFIFVQYYNDIKINGEIGFSAHSGPPGSINHKKSFHCLQSMSESRFCEKQKVLAELAKEYVDAKEVP